VLLPALSIDDEDDADMAVVLVVVVSDGTKSTDIGSSESAPTMDITTQSFKTNIQYGNKLIDKILDKIMGID
jgi:hypothetical protein